ncbi:hypothetical protein JCM10212_001227 [Sporobolomyces blumeae]
MARSTASQLAPLIGLDEQTTAEQVVPHLESISSQNEIRNYLETLVAPGPASRTFIQSYLATRFPTAARSRPTSTPSTRWATPTSSRPPSPSARASSSLASRTNRKADNVLERDDPGGWGKPKGATSSSSSARPSRSATPLPPPPPCKTPTDLGANPSMSKSKPTVVTVANERELELTEEGAHELLEIDRALRRFDDSRPGKSRRSCFCQARQHPLSTYTPLCPTCALVLCSLNSPTSPCPSCAHAPLLSPTMVSAHVSTLTDRRVALIERERVKRERIEAQREAERRAIKFPELGADYRPQPTAGGLYGGGGYAGHAGGGMSFNDRLQRAYETGVTLNGGGSSRTSSTSETRSDPNRQGKVLRLDGKGKVKVQTKVPKPNNSKGGKGKADRQHVVVEEKVVSVEDDEAADGLVPWLDETDDGLHAASSLSDETSRPTAPNRTGRPFENITLAETNRPVWIERAELSHSIVDDADGHEPTLESVPASGSAQSGNGSGGGATTKKVPGAANANGGGAGADGKKKKGKKTGP